MYLVSNNKWKGEPVSSTSHECYHNPLFVTCCLFRVVHSLARGVVNWKVLSSTRGILHS